MDQRADEPEDLRDHTGEGAPDDGWASRPLPAAHDLGGGHRVVRSAVYAGVPGYRPLEVDLHTAGDAPAGRRGRPVLLWVHGGGWRGGARYDLPTVLREADMHRAVAERGYLVASIDYRLSAEAPFPAQLHDVKAALRWLRHRAADLGADPGRIAVWGESAGGHLAALAALTPDADDPYLEGAVGVRGPSSAVRAAVAWYPVTDFATLEQQWRAVERAGDEAEAVGNPEEQLLGGSPDEVPLVARSASPVHHVSAAAPPLLVQHGTEDRVVPVAQSDELVAALRDLGAPVEYDRVEGYDHCFDGHPEPAALLEPVIAFLDRHLA